MKAASVICALLAVMSGSLATAGNNPEIGVSVHVMAHASKRTCSGGLPSIRGCEDLKTSESSADTDCFPVFYELSEYLGVEYGLAWPGNYTCTFTSCSDLVIGEIINPGDGIAHTWLSCQAGRVAIPGWARIYEPAGGRVCVVPPPATGEIYVLDCDDGLDGPEEAPSCAGIGGRPGDDPCGGYRPPTEEGTWGEIKTMFD
jgi:hypothetical protein